MNKQNIIPEKTSEWLEYISKKVSSNEGLFQDFDENGLLIVLEWTKADIRSPELAAFKQNICKMASDTIASSETHFLRSYPQAVSQELFLKPCSSYFENQGENINWLAVEETIKSTIKQFYMADLSKFGMDMIKPLLADIYFLVKAREEKTKKLIGFLMSAITPALPYGNVKVINACVDCAETNRGIERILLSTLFKTMPEIKRLFMFTRPTNDYDLKTYQSLGFTIDENPFQDPNHKINTDYLVSMEYTTDTSETLLRS